MTASLLFLSASLAPLLLAPHLILRTRLSPVAGVSLWTTALLLRASLMVAAAAAALVVVPGTQAFHVVAQWCLHTIVPFAERHLGVGGHRLADAAVLVPTLIIFASVAGAFFGGWRGACAVSRWLRRATVGRRSDGAVIVADPGMLMASTGLRRPEIVVSAGALLELEDDELEAGLAHEQGHVRRCHRFVTVLSLGLLAVGRLIPGGDRAYREVQYHLERDADEYAVRRTGDPLALASAICKVATAGITPSSAFTQHRLAGGSDPCDRLEALTAHLEPRRSANRGAWLLVGWMSLAAAGVLIAVPGLGLGPGTAPALTAQAAICT